MTVFKLNISAIIIGAFLAIPALTAPSGDVVGARAPTVADVIPREYIEEVRAYYEGLTQAKARAEYHNAKRALSSLEKRVPENHLCHQADDWLERQCRSDISARAYRDDCLSDEGDRYHAFGECDVGTVCMDVSVPNGKDYRGDPQFIEDILCVPGTPPTQDVKAPNNRQYGTRYYDSPDSRTVDFGVEILVDNPSASVSADILDSDRTWAIKPPATLTANLRGYKLNLCKQDPANALENSRQCVPDKPHNLRSGQFIDFTFALSGDQTGYLFYSIA